MSGAMFAHLTAGVTTSYWALLSIMMLMAAGMATIMPAMTSSIMSAVPMGKAGVGSAMNDTTRELGGALGVAVLGSLVAGRYDSRLVAGLGALTSPLRDKAEESLVGALQVAGRVGGVDGRRIVAVAREAYVSGMHLAAAVAGFVALVASAIVYRYLPAVSQCPDGGTAGAPATSAGEPAELVAP